MNIRKLVVVTGMLSLWGAGSLSWGADDPARAPQDLQAYLDQLMVKMDHTAQRVNQPSAEASSVAGLRGAKQPAESDTLYWKAKAGKAKPRPEEVQLVRDALHQAQEGKTDDAVATLKVFEKKYPKSPLEPDVQETLRRLSPPPVK